ATLVPTDGGFALVDGEVPGKVNLLQADGTLYNPTAFKLTTAEGFTYALDQLKGLTQVTDLNGNTLTITPNGVIHSAGKSIVFHRDRQGRIATMVDPQGNTQYYGYNPDTGDLQSFTDRQSNTTLYAYVADGSSPPHLLSTITDARGVQAIQNAYFLSGLLRFSRDASGNQISFNIQQATNQETITDRNGNSSTYVYDMDGNVTSMVDALGHSTAMTYDAAGNKLSETRTDDAGRALVTSFVYDDHSNLTLETDPLGNQTQYE